MYVRTANDIVGSEVVNRNVWHEPETIRLLARLEKRAREVHYKNPKLTPAQARKQVALLDVGANQGWFSLVALGMGFSSVSVEAMPSNEMLLRSSLCANAHLGFLDRSIVFPVAVGDVKGDMCTILSVEGDSGNGNVHCNSSEAPKDAFDRDLVFRGMARLTTLDSLFSALKTMTKSQKGAWHDVWSKIQVGAAKIDVEGFEFRAIFGGKSQLFDKTASQIPSILIEYSPDMLGQMSRGDQSFSAHALLDFMEQRGYQINMGGFVVDQASSALGAKAGKEHVFTWEKQVGKGLGAITDIYFQLP
jgi:hypothetical protein